MTDDEASRIVCHRTLTLQRIGDPARGAFCIGSECMAWARPTIQGMPADAPDALAEPQPPEGYCRDFPAP
jgi:hypothetical protein